MDHLWPHEERCLCNLSSVMVEVESLLPQLCKTRQLGDEYRDYSLRKIHPMVSWLGLSHQDPDFSITEFTWLSIQMSLQKCVSVRYIAQSSDMHSFPPLSLQKTRVLL